MTNIDFQQKLPINSLFLSKVLTPNQMERFVTPMEENINAKTKKTKKGKQICLWKQNLNGQN